MLVAGCHDGLRLYHMEARLQPSDVHLTVSDPQVPSQPGQACEQQQDIAAQGKLHLHIAVELVAQVCQGLLRATAGSSLSACATVHVGCCRDESCGQRCASGVVPAHISQESLTAACTDA